MKIVVKPPSDADAAFSAISEAGQKVKVRELHIEPFFWSADGRPIVLTFETHLDESEDEEELVQRGTVNISGKNGKLSVNDRTEKHQAAIEKKKKKGTKRRPAEEEEYEYVDAEDEEEEEEEGEDE